MDDNYGCFVQLIVAVVTIVACALITKAIWNSDMPMWLKFFLLR